MAWEDLVNTGLITRPDFVRLVSTQAARLFGIHPQKGVIAPGSDADVIVLDPAVKHVISAKTHFSNIDTNVYEGKHITGKVRAPCCTQQLCVMMGAKGMVKGVLGFVTAFGTQQSAYGEVGTLMLNLLAGPFARGQTGRELQKRNIHCKLFRQICRMTLTVPLASNSLCCLSQVTTTISRGRIAYEENQVKLQAGSGRFVKLKPFAPAVFDGLEEEGAARLQAMFPYGKVPVKREGDVPAKDEL